MSRDYPITDLKATVFFRNLIVKEFLHNYLILIKFIVLYLLTKKSAGYKAPALSNPWRFVNMLRNYTHLTIHAQIWLRKDISIKKNKEVTNG
jgi:hypothetical protein